MSSLEGVGIYTLVLFERWRIGYQRFGTILGPPCYYNRFSPGSMHSFTDLQALDEYLAELDAAAAVSDDRLRAMFNSFEWRREPTPEKDPYSAAYKEWQMSLYSALAGVTNYDTANERSHFDVDQAVGRPFPYLTGSPSTVGDHLMGIGFLIKTAGIGPGARVLEFGPGWGNTTLAFAQLGCHVTAVDIEPNFVDLVNRRVRAAGLEVEAIRGDFNLFYDSDRQFDAVVFFESFHHCSDHLLLLHSLRNRVPADGVVVFAGEPIVEGFPVPWGVRLDGHVRLEYTQVSLAGAGISGILLRSHHDAARMGPDQTRYYRCLDWHGICRQTLSGNLSDGRLYLTAGRRRFLGDE